MWNDPGPPWHAQTGGPLLCVYRFLYGAERDRRTSCEEKKNALLGNLAKCDLPFHLFKRVGHGRSQEG